MRAGREVGRSSRGGSIVGAGRLTGEIPGKIPI